ncbi:bifunctional pyr operon transcriptional regulator/uracil phosphoribosyltransferase PyrR [Roseivirga sp. BDSF3-8]|uniref:bifunctional pyr operon transcriptional regulator/uracil phosphoribosyltransferase PyrR n=1 Tax=Roseivirga sp. BDSF3-8 TaxID=3241598 RepID=UPI003531CFF5
MEKRQLFDSSLLRITISRLCHQLIERHDDFSDTVFLGLQPRGIYLAERIKSRLKELTDIDVPLGYLDTTFHRDDFRRRDSPLRANATKVPFIIEDKRVVVIDDVLYTGRSVRAAFDAMGAFGRSRSIELLVLIKRKYSRELPISADYSGRSINTTPKQKVLVQLKEQGFDEDNIWIINKETN